MGKLIPSVPDCLSASVFFMLIAATVKTCTISQAFCMFQALLPVLCGLILTHPGPCQISVLGRLTDEVPGRLGRWPGRGAASSNPAPSKLKSELLPSPPSRDPQAARAPG